MGWIQFSQIAKEASWHDSSLYLIQGLHSVTSHTAKWWFLHSLLITRRTRIYGPKNRTSPGVSATVALPFWLFQCSFAARGNPGPFPILAQNCWKFFKGCVTSRTLLMFHCLQYWMEAFVWVDARHEGGFLTVLQSRVGTSLMLNQWRSKPRIESNSAASAKVLRRTQWGEGTADLWIFTGHKVEHNVSTDGASNSNSSQATDHRGGKARPK